MSQAPAARSGRGLFHYRGILRGKRGHLPVPVSRFPALNLLENGRVGCSPEDPWKILGEIVHEQRGCVVGEPNGKIKVGISACLLGEGVRYDGGHKHDRYITGTLGRYFEWVPVCPELEAGLGVPRPALRLETREGRVRLIQHKTEADMTELMEDYSRNRVAALQSMDLSGYILKSKSPSCGKGGIKVYAGYGVRPATHGVGVFADLIMKALPNLPVEDEGRLCDPNLRENWVRRVFVYAHFKKELREEPTVNKLIRFHTAYKFMILAHCPEAYQELGRVVASASDEPIGEVVARYETGLMTALKKVATRPKNVNVLHHMLGFFRDELSESVRRELLESIVDYQEGFVPLIVPVTLIRHYANQLKIYYLTNQVYLAPHPKELALLSRI